jgi:hypothetical protein
MMGRGREILPTGSQSDENHEEQGTRHLQSMLAELPEQCRQSMTPHREAAREVSEESERTRAKTLSRTNLEQRWPRSPWPSYTAKKAPLSILLRVGRTE